MPWSSAAAIVARLSSSLTSSVVTPAMGQPPNATGETWIEVGPNGRRSVARGASLCEDWSCVGIG